MTRTVFASVIAMTVIHGSPTAAQSSLRKSPELAFSVGGQGEKLLSQYRGKVVALEFILTTCPHCQAASKVMTAMQERFANRGFQALDVAIDPNADLRVEGFSKDY